jgi:2-isopropylmalate synthase
MRIEFYDVTLREGSQKFGINFSLMDKMTIAKMLLQDLGVDYIEAGWPFSNPNAMEFFQTAKTQIPTLFEKFTAFGSTSMVERAEKDPNLNSIIESGVKYACIFGKSWDFHVPIIHKTLEENLQIVEDSIRYLTNNGLKVIFDAEHFYDGYKANPDYAIEVLKAAAKGGAINLSLCDTNGGTLPSEIFGITEDVIRKINLPVSLHSHNDSGLADANALSFIQVCEKHQRDCMIQATLRGIGERCGNTNLITTIANVVLKLKKNTNITENNLKKATDVARRFNEILNEDMPQNDPYIGVNAFSHKGGVHISAVEKDSNAYEHVSPTLVGNKRAILVSEMAGKAAIIAKAKDFGIYLDKEKDKEAIELILETIKRKEMKGYSYEEAEGSLEILIRGIKEGKTAAANHYRKKYFKVDYFRVITDVRKVFEDPGIEIFSDANIKVLMNKDGKESEFHTAAEGNGPVNAIDNAMRKALIYYYEDLKEINLVDFKVRIVTGEKDKKGTGSVVRVLVKSTDKSGKIWGTIGVHENVIIASFVALIDSYVYKLLKDGQKPLGER